MNQSRGCPGFPEGMMKLRIGWHTTQQIDNNASNILFVRREVFFKKSILFINQHSLNYILGMYLEMLQQYVYFHLPFGEKTSACCNNGILQNV